MSKPTEPSNLANQSRILVGSREDSVARERYAVLADGDMEFYLAAKAELVAELLTRGRARVAIDRVLAEVLRAPRGLRRSEIGGGLRIAEPE
ncbi:MAG: hypothetical protein ACRDSE_24825 [Pseudonocardiaceae bacterium]